jgi:trehalose 6-phosphate synthase
MNLVAKEFVAAQDPQDPGVLVLSRFAGAARQLDGAILVNPHDQDEIADALDAALEMSLPRRQARWQSMWRSIENASALGWGRSFVAALLRTPASVISLAKKREPSVSEPVCMSPHGIVSESLRTLVDGRHIN